MGPKVKRILWRAAAAAALMAVALMGHLAVRQLTGNFAVVVPGEVYRSNQPTPERLAEYQARYGIRTVLNLRGGDGRAEWYRAEQAAARTLGLQLIDFPLDARESLTRAQFDALLQILKTAPKPLLIHCRSGSDRTGLASVIYQTLVAGMDEELAEGQLSLRFGHFSVPLLSATWPMDTSWEQIEDWAGIEDS